MTGSRTQVTAKMSPIQIFFVNIKSIEALHVTYYTVNMADYSSPFKRSVITTYHHSLSTVYQMHWYQIGQ